MAPYTMLIPAAALISLALFGSRARQLAGGIGAAAITIAAEALNQHRPGVLATAQHVAQLALPILAVEALRTRRDYRSVLGERVALVKLTREQEARRRVQDERLRIARDLHDVVAHTLTTINVQASVAGHLLDRRPEQARHALTVIEDASRDALTELRAILGVLRDPDGTLASRTPTPGLDEVADLVQLARDAGLSAHLDVTGTRPGRMPEAVSRAAYRIVQESLTNAARHTAGSSVHVVLSYAPDELAIAVENTSPSRLTPSAARPAEHAGLVSESPGVGILGMTERAQALGGTLTATASDAGFLVAARLPYCTG
jgi:signal transduction histidine kinase